MDLHSQINSALELYFRNGRWNVEVKDSGVNNTTRFISHNNRKYVIRIYENHADADKVKYEAKVLQELQQFKLSFQIPQPVPALNGEYVAVLPSGKLSMLFEYREGERADLANGKHTASIGRAMGNLVTALGHVNLGLEAAYEPYYELYEIHPLVQREELEKWLQHMKTGRFKSEAVHLEEEINRLLDHLPNLQRLPVQLVHSDIVAGNVLTIGDEVSAILDFEFVTPDLRVMDAAVFMNELIRYHGGRWDLLEAFIRGYAETASFTADEIRALPQLILLRSVVLCIHFLGRQWAGVDPHDEGEPYLNSFALVYEWMSHHQNKLLDLCYMNLEEEVRE
ncbi:MAG: aminoglycoside phosphotransferase [Paenibacillus sp.]|jgi:homoserine kinase type II|nr:aminoglycoside phosphotransferase [Paenibacillus sp.]